MSPDELKQQIRQITVWKRGEQAAKGSGHGKRTLAGDCAEVVVLGEEE